MSTEPKAVPAHEEQELTRDSFLQTLIELNTSLNGEIPITLQVSGMLVSGILIHYSKYFEQTADAMAKGFQDPEAGEAMRTFLLEWARPPEGDESPPRLNYVHLREAKFFVPGGEPIPTNRGVLWRGLISAVSGFTLGGLSHDRRSGVSG